MTKSFSFTPRKLEDGAAVYNIAINNLSIFTTLKLYNINNCNIMFYRTPLRMYLSSDIDVDTQKSIERIVRESSQVLKNNIEKILKKYSQSEDKIIEKIIKKVSNLEYLKFHLNSLAVTISSLFNVQVILSYDNDTNSITLDVSKC